MPWFSFLMTFTFNFLIRHPYFWFVCLFKPNFWFCLLNLLFYYLCTWVRNMSVISIKLDFQRLEQIGVHFSHGARSQELAFGASIHRLSTVTGGRGSPFPCCRRWHTGCRLHVCCLQDDPIWLLSRHPSTVRTATERQEEVFLILRLYLFRSGVLSSHPADFPLLH